MLSSTTTNVDIVERLKDYNKPWCFQYQKRLDNLEQDLIVYGLTKEEAEKLKVSDFTFKVINRKNKTAMAEVKAFIEKHEWLGKLAQRNTHFFGVYYKDTLAGVVIMSTPNAFSKLLGDKTKGVEKLISRGATASFTPKNLASKLISYALDWMVKNTEFRVFSAYSDPEAKELGTIYQALGAIYLGNDFGGNEQIFDSANPHKGWHSDREARKLSAYKRYAKNAGIIWNSSWSTKDKIHWSNMPTGVQSLLRQASRDYVDNCEKRITPKKHKYVFLKGVDRRETKFLEREFLKHNPDLCYRTKDGRLIGKEYPKVRGE